MRTALSTDLGPRSLAVLLAGALTVALLSFGCGGPQTSETADTAEVTPEAAETPPASEGAGGDAEAGGGDAQAEEPAAAPEEGGGGEALVRDRCLGCHGLDRIASESHDRQEWTQIVDSMVGRGARLNDQERQVVIDYLVASFGPE